MGLDRLSKAWVGIACLGLSMAPNAGGQPVSAEALEVSFGCRVDSDSNGLLLEAEIKNVSSETIRVFTADLPWNHPQSVLIVIATLDGAVLEDVARFDIINPSPGVTYLRSGESVSGTIDLTQRFSANKLFDRSLSIVFYSYSLRSVDRTAFGRVFGGFEIQSLPDGSKRCGVPTSRIATTDQ